MESKKYDILKGMMKYLDFKKDDLIKGDGALSILMPISYPVIDSDEEEGPIDTHEEAAHAFEGIGEYMMDRYYEYPDDFGEDYNTSMGEGENPPSYNIIHTNNGPKMKVTIADKLAMVIQRLSGNDARALSSSTLGEKTTHRESDNPEWTGFALLKKGEGDSVYLSRYFGNDSGLGLINNITDTYDNNNDNNTWKKLDGFSWNDIIK